MANYPNPNAASSVSSTNTAFSVSSALPNGVDITPTIFAQIVSFLELQYSQISVLLEQSFPLTKSDCIKRGWLTEEANMGHLLTNFLLIIVFSLLCIISSGFTLFVAFVCTLFPLYQSFYALLHSQLSLWATPPMSTQVSTSTSCSEEGSTVVGDSNLNGVAIDEEECRDHEENEFLKENLLCYWLFFACFYLAELVLPIETHKPWYVVLKCGILMFCYLPQTNGCRFFMSLYMRREIANYSSWISSTSCSNKKSKKFI